MAWNNDSTIRDLGDYCDKHGYAIGVFFGLQVDDEIIAVNSYGKTLSLCKVAKQLAEQTFEAIESGTIVPKG